MPCRNLRESCTMTVRSGTCYCCDLYNCAKWENHYFFWVFSASISHHTLFVLWILFTYAELRLWDFITRLIKQNSFFVFQWRLYEQLLWVCWSAKLWGSFHPVHFNLDPHRREPGGLFHRDTDRCRAGKHQVLGMIIHSTVIHPHICDFDWRVQSGPEELRKDFLSFF